MKKVAKKFGSFKNYSYLCSVKIKQIIINLKQ